MYQMSGKQAYIENFVSSLSLNYSFIMRITQISLINSCSFASKPIGNGLFLHFFDKRCPVQMQNQCRQCINFTQIGLTLHTRFRLHNVIFAITLDIILALLGCSHISRILWLDSMHTKLLVRLLHMFWFNSNLSDLI